MKTRLYISGSITDGGRATDQQIQQNLAAFFEAEEHLTDAGFVTLNPARHGVDPDMSWREYMRLALRDISIAEGLAMLPGWQHSRGARIEQRLAVDLGIPVLMVGEWVEQA